MPRSGRMRTVNNRRKKAGFSKRFRCGRVMINKNGEVKKLGLGKGGGSRYCKWYYKWMNFDDVRRQLVQVFNLNVDENEIVLYDFQLQPLDENQYQSIFRYVNVNGLTCNGTILYVYIPNDNDNTNNESEEVSSPSNERVIKVESNLNPQKTYLNYSFKSTIDDLVINIRQYLLNSNNIDKTLVQLFENSSILYGYICSTIHPIQQQLNFQLIHETEHLNILNDIIDICKSMKTLIELNKEKLDKIPNFSSTINKFTQFHRNLRFWFDHANNQNTSHSNQDENQSNVQQEQSEDKHLIPHKKIKLEKQDKSMDIASYSSSNV